MGTGYDLSASSTTGRPIAPSAAKRGSRASSSQPCRPRRTQVHSPHLTLEKGPRGMSRHPRPIESLLLPLKPESLQSVPSRPLTTLLRIDGDVSLNNRRCIHRFMEYVRPESKRRVPKRRTAAVAIMSVGREDQMAGYRLPSWFRPFDESLVADAGSSVSSSDAWVISTCSSQRD
jgi:hypothetical protein